MRLRPFFGYYGGKWRDTPQRYPAPEYQALIEPFAGSAGYATRHHDRSVALYEADPIVAGVWSFLIRAKSSEILRIPDIGPDDHVESLRACPEARWLVGFWLNRAVTSPRPRPSKWMREGIRPGSFWGERVRAMIAAQVPFIRHWRIHNLSYAECLQQGPATWFIDPPYELAGRHYRYGSSLLDYRELARWCRARLGQAIVCENAGATWLPFKPVGDAKTTRRGTLSSEVCWVGGRSNVAEIRSGPAHPRPRLARSG